MKTIFYILAIITLLAGCNSMQTQGYSVNLDIPDGDYYIWQCYAQPDYRHQQKPLLLVASKQDQTGYIYYHEKTEKAYQQTEGLTRTWYWGPNYREKLIEFSIMLQPNGRAKYRNETAKTFDSKYQSFKCIQTQ